MQLQGSQGLKLGRDNMFETGHWLIVHISYSLTNGLLCCWVATLMRRQLLATQGRQLGVQQAWQLVSELLLVKYSCLLAVPAIMGLKRPSQVAVLGGNVLTSLKAMAAHRSQWVW